MPTPAKTVSIEPLSGALDLRSPLGAASFGDFRFILNASMNEHRRRCRRSGWKKALADSEFGFSNQDLHDQLLYQQLYYGANELNLTGGGVLTGYQTSHRYPAYDVEVMTREITELGEMCGYAEDFYGIYGTNPDALSGIFMHDPVVGYPYVPCEEAPTEEVSDPLTGDVPYNDGAGFSLPTTEVDGELQINLFDVFPKFLLPSSTPPAYYSTPDLIIGPFDVEVEIYNLNIMSADDEIHTSVDSDPLADIGPYPIAAETVLVTLTPGQVWNVNIYNAYTGGWIGVGENFGSGAEEATDNGACILRVRATGTTTTHTGCHTGAPYYCITSSFSLSEISISSETVHFDSFDYGQSLPSYTPQFDYTFNDCQELYLEQRFCREHITFLHEFRSSSGLRRLIAATKSRAYILSDSSSTWRILADRLGGDAKADDCTSCPEIRFHAASLGDYLVMTNNFDPVLYWEIDTLGEGCDLWALKSIDDLTVLGVTRSKVVAEWKGFIFLGNLEEEYTDKPNVIIWSDFNAPLSFVPGGESIAGRHEFGTGQRILRIAPMGDYLYIYTDQAIYQGILIGAEDEVFRFREIYRGPNTPRYSNAFVNTGDYHIWAALDGLYVINGYTPQPQRIEWIHKADGAIYNGASAETLDSFDHLNPFNRLDETSCENMVAFYNELNQEVWFSWPTSGNDCPNMSLVLNLRYGAADVVDYGFTAGCNYTEDRRPSVRDFFTEFGICDPEEFGKDPKEGCPRASSAEVEDQVLYLVNPTEDPDLPTHPDSLCSRLENLTLEEVCGDCESPRTFLTASASDKTIKEHDREVFYREEFVETGLSNYFFDPQQGFVWTGDPCGTYEYVYADQPDNYQELYDEDCLENTFILRFIAYFPWQSYTLSLTYYDENGDLISGPTEITSASGGGSGGGIGLASVGYCLDDPDSPIQPGVERYLKVNATVIDQSEIVHSYETTHHINSISAGGAFCVPFDFNGCGSLALVKVTNGYHLCDSDPDKFNINGSGHFQIYSGATLVTERTIEDTACETPTSAECCGGDCVDETSRWSLCGAHSGDVYYALVNVLPDGYATNAVLQDLSCSCGDYYACIEAGSQYTLKLDHGSNYDNAIDEDFEPVETSFTFTAEVGMRLTWDVRKSLEDSRGNGSYDPSNAVAFSTPDCASDAEIIGESGNQFIDCDYPDTNCDQFGFGSVEGYYVKRGYCTMLQADASKFNTDAEKMIREVKVDFTAGDQTIPNKLKAQVSWGAQSGCLQWENIGENDLACLTSRSDAQHVSANSRANLEASYACFRRGNQIAWRFWVDAPEGSPQITGGEACFNKVSLQIRVPEVRPR